MLRKFNPYLIGWRFVRIRLGQRVSAHRTAAEVKPLRMVPNLSMIDIDLKAIWEMSVQSGPLKWG